MKKHLITLSTLAIAAVAFVGCQTDDTMNEPAGAEMETSTDVNMNNGSADVQGTIDAEDELRRSGSYRSNTGVGGSSGASTGDSSDFSRSPSRGGSSGSATGTGTGSSSGTGGTGGATQP